MKNEENRLLDKFFVLFFYVCKLKINGNNVLKTRRLHTLTTYLGPLPTTMLLFAVVGHPPTVRAVPGLSICALMASPLKFLTPEWPAAPLQANSDQTYWFTNNKDSQTEGDCSVEVNMLSVDVSHSSCKI